MEPVCYYHCDDCCFVLPEGDVVHLRMVDDEMLLVVMQYDLQVILGIEHLD